MKRKLRLRITAYLLAFIMCLPLAEIPEEARAAAGEQSDASGFTYNILDDGTLEITGYRGTAENVIIPDAIEGRKVTTIGEEAFQGCSSLKSIKLPESLTSIGVRAFIDSGLESIELPESVTSIGALAFQWCSSLKSIELLGGVTSIDYQTFYQCSNLERVKLPEGLTSIGGLAFDGCSSLKSIELPESLMSIGYSAFYGCEKLQEVFYAGSRSQWQKITIAEKNECLSNATFHCSIVESDISLCNVSVSPSSYVYDGTAKMPTVTVKNGNKTLKVGTDYILSYKDNVNVGTASVAVTGKGKYKGTVTKTFTITKKETSYIKTPSLTVKLNSANSVKLSWKKVSGAQGYEVYRSTSKSSGYKRIITVKGVSHLSCLDNNLKSGKTYYYKVAAYKASGGRKVSSAKSKAKSKKIIGTLKAPKLNILVDKQTDRFVISWNNVKGADKIEILRATRNGKFKKWKTVSAKSRKVSYSNKSLKKGVAYGFTLRAYYTMDGKKIYSGRSRAYSISR